MVPIVVAALFAALIALRGPAVGPETVVVLPNDGAKIGGVVVRRGNQEQVLDTAYAASRVGRNGVLERERLTPEQVQRDYGKTLAALPPKPESFLLYFVTGTDELTDASKADLQRVLADMRKRPVPDLQLIGHTDTVGTAPANEQLSIQRAQRVRALLLEAGIRPDRIEVIGRGEHDLIVHTGDQVAEQRNRSVEVIVR